MNNYRNQEAEAQREKHFFFFRSHEFRWRGASAEPEVEERIGARPVFIPLKKPAADQGCG